MIREDRRTWAREMLRDEDALVACGTEGAAGAVLLVVSRNTSLALFPDLLIKYTRISPVAVGRFT